VGEDLDQLVEALGAVLAAPDLPRLTRNEPGLDKKWAAGDLAARIPKSQLDEVARRIGLGVGQLRSYAEVARAYPPKERTVKAAWTIYREVRILSPEKRKEVLQDGLTLRRARIALGKGPMDRPKKERESDEDRAWFILEELQEPRVKAIVEREIASANVDRKARRAAKTTLDEIAAQKRFIENELRKVAKEGTPDRQYWLASKELVGAEQYIYSVARLHQQHGDAMDEERWADIVKKLRHVADSAQDVADRIEGLAAGDFIDAEEVSEYLELPSGNGGDFDAEIVDAEIIGDSS
jgi:hypothetical protein